MKTSRAGIILDHRVPLRVSVLTWRGMSNQGIVAAGREVVLVGKCLFVTD